jgi:hypothetical protein
LLKQSKRFIVILSKNFCFNCKTADPPNVIFVKRPENPGSNVIHITATCGKHYEQSYFFNKDNVIISEEQYINYATEYIKQMLELNVYVKSDYEEVISTTFKKSLGCRYKQVLDWCSKFFTEKVIKEIIE